MQRLTGLLITLVLIAFSSINANGQSALSDANITGHVVEHGTEEHMPGVVIKLDGTALGAMTDATGHYNITNITPGDYTIEARCAGFVTQRRKITVKARTTLEVNFDIIPDAMQLEQVVVTGNRSEVKRRESSSLVNIVGSPTFNLVGAACLADGLSFQPGVRVENDCQNCGFTQVRINGLDGHYSQILMNSRPIFSALTGVYGLEQIPSNMIDRVEVMRGDRLDEQPHRAMIAEQTDHNIHALDLGANFRSPSGKNRYNVFASMQNTRRQSYYGSDMDPDAYGRTHDLVVVSGGQYIHSFDRLWFMPAELTGGLEYNYNYLHDVTLGYEHDVTQRINIYSGYLQNEWRDERWGFLVGARVDKHSLIHHAIVSPRANIRFNPMPDLNLRLCYSTGFRSPQAYDEDFHVAIVGGERVVTILDPDLREESSQSVSMSADFYRLIGNVQCNFTLEGFYTDLSHVFVLRQLEEPDAAGNAVLMRTNGAGARVWGMSLEARASMPWRMNVQAGLTLQKSRYKEPEVWSDNPDVAPVKRMFRTPDCYGYVTLSYNPLKALQIAVSGTYTGRMLVEHLAGSGTAIDRAHLTRRFFDANFKVSYDFKLFDFAELELNAGIQNIFNAYQHDFDQGPMRDSGYIYGPTLPRSLTAGLKLKI